MLGRLIAAAMCMSVLVGARTIEDSGNYFVYFQSESRSITVEAGEVIALAAAFYKAHPKSRVRVTGTADQAGSRKYNIRLSRSRARVVADCLVQLGVMRNKMSVKWTGEDRLTYPSPSDGRQPLNRYVEVAFND